MAKTGPKGPRINFDYDLFGNLCEMGCTQKEIMSTMKIKAKETMNRALQHRYGVTFRKARRMFQCSRNVVLRKLIWDKAMAGEWKALKHLSDTRLGTSRKTSHREEDFQSYEPAPSSFSSDPRRVAVLNELRDKWNKILNSNEINTGTDTDTESD